jgi:hypothetical protein
MTKYSDIRDLMGAPLVGRIALATASCVNARAGKQVPEGKINPRYDLKI